MLFYLYMYQKNTITIYINGKKLHHFFLLANKEKLVLKLLSLKCKIFVGSEKKDNTTCSGVRRNFTRGVRPKFF